MLVIRASRYYFAFNSILSANGFAYAQHSRVQYFAESRGMADSDILPVFENFEKCVTCFKATADK